MYDRLVRKEATLAVIGLGYVGLPIALEFEFVNNIGHFGVPDIFYVFFKSSAHYQHFGFRYGFTLFNHELHQLVGDVGAHAVVDGATAQNYFGIVAQSFGFISQIVRIYTNAMTTHQARKKF